MADYRIAAFLLVIGAAAALVPWAAARARRRGGEQVAQAFDTLTEKGWVVEQGVTPHGRAVVRAWGLLAHPVALDLRVIPRSRFFGGLTRGSSGMLDPVFESSFRIASSEADRARLILEPEIQQRLLRLPRAELGLGSFDSMLPREYSSGEGAAQDRRLRRLWMIRLPGKLAKLAAPEELAEIGRLLTLCVEKHCLPPGSPDRSQFETAASEGWI